MIQILIFAGCTLLGAILFMLGLHGRRVNDHPICAKCRFDLVGTPDATACPECGRELGVAGAIRRGERRRRRWAIAVGSLLLLISAGAGGVFLWGRATQYDWNKAKPTWLLLKQAEIADPPDDAILKELISRRADDPLSSATYRRLVADALRRQADPKATWSPVWGDLFLDAAALGDVTPEQRHQFLTNMTTHTLRFRTRVHASAGVPYSLQSKTDRGATNGNPMNVDFRGGELVLERDGAEPIRFPQVGGFSLGGWGGDPSTTDSAVYLAQREVPPGRYRATLTIPGVLTCNGTSVDIKPTCAGTLEVVDADEPVVSFLPDPQPKAPKAAAALALGLPYMTARFNSKTGEAERARTLQIAINVGPRDFDLAFRCTGLVTGADGSVSELSLGKFSLKQGISGTCPSAQVPLDFAAKKVTLVLTADPIAAEGSIDITQIWKGEIVLKDVPVEDSPGGVRMPQLPRE